LDEPRPDSSGRIDLDQAQEDHLTRSAEQGYPLFFARAATLQAIHRNKERVFTNRKEHQWGKRKLKRDR